MHQIKFEPDVEAETHFHDMSDEEISEELRSMRNLNMWLYRNDDGIELTEEYKGFHRYLRILMKEALRRGLVKDLDCCLLI